MFVRIFGVFSALTLFLLYLPVLIQAKTGDWYYPMTTYQDRIVVKDFGTQINKDFYQGKEALFPGMRLYGYHAAVDLDATQSEQAQDVPVYAVADGTIRYINPSVQGYGGVIIQSLDGTNDTALYGHVKTAGSNLKVGDRVAAGQRLAVLGGHFAPDSGGERKHLHFAIHKGPDLYFRGHEDTTQLLNQKWENPTAYLASRNAKQPGQPDPVLATSSNPTAPASATPAPSATAQPTSTWWSSFLAWLKNLF